MLFNSKKQIARSPTFHHLDVVARLEADGDSRVDVEVDNVLLRGGRRFEPGSEVEGGGGGARGGGGRVGPVVVEMRGGYVGGAGGGDLPGPVGAAASAPLGTRPAVRHLAGPRLLVLHLHHHCTRAACNRRGQSDGSAAAGGW